MAEWAVTQRLAIMNTLFQKHPDKQWTHEGGEEGSVKRQIDYFCFDANRRHMVLDSGACTKMNMNSDHRAVFVKTRFDKHLIQKLVGWKPSNDGYYKHMLESKFHDINLKQHLVDKSVDF